jgi:diguanylate cyclase (GGDEF)-like protein
VPQVLASKLILQYIVMDVVMIIILASVMIRLKIGMELINLRIVCAKVCFCLIAYAISDIGYAIMKMDPFYIGSPNILLYLFSIIYFAAAGLGCYYVFLTMETLLGSNLSKNKRLTSYSALFIAIYIIMNFTTPLTHLMFWIDGNNSYQHGSLYILEYLVPGMYVALASVRAAVAGKKGSRYADRGFYSGLAFIPIIPGIFCLVQYTFGVPAFGIGCSIMIMNVYMSIMSKNVSIDPLTNLNNRRNLITRLDARIENRTENTILYVLMMDIDKFKAINDTYGHPVGDEALIRTADVLQKSVAGKKNTVLARYGGDEFIIAGETETEDEIEDIKAFISREMKESNKTAKAPYKLTISIGTAIWNSEYKNAANLINAADKNLYLAKSRLNLKRN